jgi:hypothetical protein
MGTWRETRRRAERGPFECLEKRCCPFPCLSLGTATWTMVVVGSDDDRVGGGNSNPAAHRWGPDSQGGETSAAEMLQSLQPVRDLAQNFDIDIAT